MGKLLDYDYAITHLQDLLKLTTNRVTKRTYQLAIEALEVQRWEHSIFSENNMRVMLVVSDIENILFVYYGADDEKYNLPTKAEIVYLFKDIDFIMEAVSNRENLQESDVIEYTWHEFVKLARDDCSVHQIYVNNKLISKDPITKTEAVNAILDYLEYEGE